MSNDPGLLWQEIMHVAVVTTGTPRRAKFQSKHHHQHINPHFLQAGCLSCRPTPSVTSPKAEELCKYNSKMKRRSEVMQTLHAGRSKANPQTNKHTNRQGRLQYTAQLSARCNKWATFDSLILEQHLSNARMCSCSDAAAWCSQASISPR